MHGRYVARLICLLSASRSYRPRLARPFRLPAGQSESLDRLPPQLPAVRAYADHRTHAGTANATRPRRRQPLTDPAISPRTKYRCSEKKTTNGIMMVTNAPEVSTCQSCPREPTSSAKRVVTSA